MKNENENENEDRGVSPNPLPVHYLLLPVILTIHLLSPSFPETYQSLIFQENPLPTNNVCKN